MKKLIDQVLTIEIVDHRIMSLCILLSKIILNIKSEYTTQSDRTATEKNELTVI